MSPSTCLMHSWFQVSLARCNYCTGYITVNYKKCFHEKKRYNSSSSKISSKLITLPLSLSWGRPGCMSDRASPSTHTERLLFLSCVDTWVLHAWHSVDTQHCVGGKYPGFMSPTRALTYSWVPVPFLPRGHGWPWEGWLGISTMASSSIKLKWRWWPQLMEMLERWYLSAMPLTVLDL